MRPRVRGGVEGGVRRDVDGCEPVTEVLEEDIRLGGDIDGEVGRLVYDQRTFEIEYKARRRRHTIFNYKVNDIKSVLAE